MRSLTFAQWMGAAISTQVAVAAGMAGFGIDSPPAEVKVLGTSVSKSAVKDSSLIDKKVILASGTVEGLYPGAALDLPVLLENPNNFDVVVTELSVGVAHASSSCRAVNVDAEDFAGRRLVPKNGTAVQSIVVHMHHDAPDVCKNAEWQLTYSGRAEKDKL